MTSFSSRILVVWFVIGVCSFRLSAKDSSPIGQQWVKALEKASSLLREHRFDDARQQLEDLKRSMLDRIGPGEPADRLFAIVVGQLAVAQAGSGRIDEAIWNWHTAQNIVPEIRSLDLSTYGPAGQLLTNHILPPRPERCVRSMLESPSRIRKRVEPDYPDGARQFHESGIVIVQIRLDENGHPVQPEVLKSLAAPITYSALDALRRWRFEPPGIDHPQRSAPFCVTFNFRLR